ncbi:MAG: HAD-IIIA family hydrolase [Deltaproteobacteria bacterium]|nr:HAD-IIIA family hydrolase [Deltaproteobacteria bacterium]
MTKKFRHGLEVLLVSMLQGWVALIPLKAIPLAGSLLGGFLFSVLRLKRRLTLHNLDLALGAVTSPQERLAIARGCYRFFGMVILEVMSLGRVAKGRLSDHLTVENPQVLDEALKGGKGVILVSGHFGNWELMGGGLSRLGYVLSMYVGRQHNPRIDQMVNRLRRTLGTETVPEGASMRVMLKALKANRIVAMLSDQHFSRKIHFIHFFGKPVSQVPGPASLALRTGARLVVGLCRRTGPFQYRVHLEEIPVRPSGNEERDILVISQQAANLLESAIRRHPEQYFWMHDRWKPNPVNWRFTPVNLDFMEAMTACRRSLPPVFIDRDGTLIEEVNYLSRLDQIRPVAGGARAVAALNRAGIKVVVLSNQSGVARGYITEEFVAQTTRALGDLLAAKGAAVDAAYYCPHHPQGLPPYNVACHCRKPRPGMLEQAQKELGLTLKGGYMIGDRRSDLELGASQGLIPVLVRTGYGLQAEPDLPSDFFQRGGRVFDALPEAVYWILTREVQNPGGQPLSP